MSDCDCNKSLEANSILLPADVDLGCPATVHETVCVQGTVTITPDVISGPTRSFCVGRPFIGNCPGELTDTCIIPVSQNICVQIPLAFFATATTVTNGLVCSEPDVGPCPGPTTGCTYTIGYFRKNITFTNELITNAGGTILLGTGAGLSFPVTTDYSDDVLKFDTPSPPAPSPTPPPAPYAHQYQVLYAQLLAAKLNVLNLEAQDIEICQFALDAIDVADDFLDNSPAGGQEGAPDVQDDLALFNSGNAPGCPPHCQEP